MNEVVKWLNPYKYISKYWHNVQTYISCRIDSHSPVSGLNIYPQALGGGKNLQKYTCNTGSSQQVSIQTFILTAVFGVKLGLSQKKGLKKVCIMMYSVETLFLLKVQIAEIANNEINRHTSG